MSDVVQSLGQRIRELRNERHMSQEELAFKAGISAAHLGQIERAIKNPTVETVSKIAAALNVSVASLFREDTIPMAEGSGTTERICAYLSSMTEDEQKDMLRILRIFHGYLPKKK